LQHVFTRPEQQAGLNPADIRIAVVIPTYKRPDHLALTLRSVGAQTGAPASAAVVVENHAERSEGADVATRIFDAGDARGIVIVEPRQGNCNAYNAGFKAALTTFPNLTHVAIIDDDEIAGQDWLAQLLATSQSTGADIVGGPQRPVFQDEDGARRYRSHPVFRSSHGSTGSAKLVTSTGNVLMSVAVLREMSPDFLDERFNFLGGGDTDFFTRCRGKGFTFGWSEEAAVMETVPPRRTERSWITARSIRNGLISAIIQRRHNPGFAGRVKVLAKSLALLAASPFRSIMLWRKTGSFYIGSYHMMVAAGRILSEIGYTTEQYREPEKN
jgi:GT2 family glycosyltransferase